MKIREVFSKSPEVNEWRYFRSRTGQKHFLTGIYPLIIGATAVMLLDIKLNANLANVATFGFCVFGSGALLWRSEFELVFKWISRFNRRYKFPSGLFALFGSFFLINALSQRADAQFFQGAQNVTVQRGRRAIVKNCHQNLINWVSWKNSAQII